MRRMIMVPLVSVMGLLMVAGLIAATGLPAQASAYRMQISEIWYNSPGLDTGTNASLDNEWVQLHNTSGSSINLTGWTLRDKAGHVFVFGSYAIRPHGYVKIHTGHGTPTQTDRYWNHSWYIWNNTGDTAILKNQGGSTIGKCTYVGTTRGYTYC